MLTDFLGIIDRVIQLANIRQARRKNLYAEVLKPLYVELEKVHYDYVRTLNDCLKEANNKDFINITIRTIDEKRLPLLPARQKLREFIRSLNNAGVKQEEEKEFCWAVSKYFGVERPGSTLSSTRDKLNLLRDKRHTVYGTDIPIGSEEDADRYLAIDEDPSLESYPVLQYLRDMPDGNYDKQYYAVQILLAQIKKLDEAWQDVSYAFGMLQLTVSQI
jgi:hypothetical protein